MRRPLFSTEPKISGRFFLVVVFLGLVVFGFFFVVVSSRV